MRARNHAAPRTGRTAGWLRPAGPARNESSLIALSLHAHPVLIVEDEPRISAFLAKGLSADGFTTTVAADGHTGLDFALTVDFDLVVLDIGLPDRARQRHGHGLRSRGGADDYMPMPFRFAELLARVRLRLRQRNDQPGARVDTLRAGAVYLGMGYRFTG